MARLGRCLSALLVAQCLFGAALAQMTVGETRSLAVSGARSIDVELTEAVLGIGRWEGALSLRWVRPRGWVEVTYLDDTYRIGRGDKGSVFVAVREGKSGPAAAAEEEG